MIRPIFCALAMLPGMALAADLEVSGAMVPMAPPGVMAHAAFLTLENTGVDKVSIVGVSAEGYAMAHIHQSQDLDGVATMSSVGMVELLPGQTVVFEHGGLHIMLMHPDGSRGPGDVVGIELLLSDGTRLTFDAPVMRMEHGS